MAKKLTKKSFVKMTASEIGKMTVKNQLRPMLKQARALYEKQKKIFLSHPNTYSYAFDKMEEYYEDRGIRPIGKMGKAQLQGEFFRLQEFFSSKGSTLPGARSISAEANKRIFGVDKSGRAKFRMTYEQSVDFWSAYNEFKNLEKEGYVKWATSDIIQQVLGEYMRGFFSKNRGESSYLTITDFARLKKSITERREKEEWAKEDVDAERSILYGEGPDL